MASLEELRAAAEAARTQADAMRKAETERSNKSGVGYIAAGMQGAREEQVNAARTEAQVGQLTERLRVASGAALEGLPVIGKPLRAGVERAAAGTLALAGKGSYADNLSAIQDETAAEKARNPGLQTAGEIGGTVLGAAALPSPQTIGGAIAGGVGLGEADMAVNAAMEGRAPTVPEALGTGVASAGGSVIGWYLGKTVGKLWDKFAGKNTKLPDQSLARVKELQGIVSSNGKILDDAGVKLNQKSLDRLLYRIELNARKEGLDQTLTPGSWGNFNTLRAKVAEGKLIDLTTFNNLRQQIRDSLGESASPLDEKVNRQITGWMKRYIDALPASKNSVVAGDARTAVEAWRKMNEAMQLKAKTELIAKAFDNADIEAAGGAKSLDRALQDEFKKLYKSKKIDEFSELEQKVIRKLAVGNVTTANFRRLDRFFSLSVFAPLYRSIAAGPRHVAGEAAERRAMEALGVVSGMQGLPGINPAPGVGGLAGGVLGGQAGAQMAAPNPVQVPGAGGAGGAPAQGNAPMQGGGGGGGGIKIPQFTPAGPSGVPQFPEVPGLGGIKRPGGS